MDHATKKLNIRTFSPEMKSRLLWGGVLAVLVAAYSMIWLNRSFTMSEGWVAYYSNLMDQGKVPYRDFHYFVPPLNILIDRILWKASSETFIGYRFFRLAERILLAELLYSVISKRLRPFLAMIGTFFGIVLGSSAIYDLIGDYNQSQQVILLLFCCCILVYSQNKDNLAKRRLWAFLAGVCGGLMFFQKQTIVLACFAVFSVFLLALIFTKWEKNPWQILLFLLSGVLLVLAVGFSYLLLTHSFKDFWYQVYQDTSSKGTLFDIVFGSQINTFNQKNSHIGAMLLVLFAGKINLKNPRKPLTESTARLLHGALLCTAGLCFGLPYSAPLLASVKDNSATWLFPLALLLCLSFLLINPEKAAFPLLIFLAGAALTILLFFDVNHMSSTLYESSAFSLVTDLITVLHFALLLWLICHLINCVVKKESVEMDLVILVCGCLTSGWATSMATGVASLSPISGFFSGPVAIAVFCRRMKLPKVTAKVTAVAALAVFTICFAQKMNCCYSWWGDTEASVAEKTETSEIPVLKGFYFSKGEKEKYDELTRVIRENTTEDSVIFGFPYVKVYNVFLDNYNMDHFVPVLFYDVCPDDFARADAETLREHEPDIVVWHDIPGCLEAHEGVFRNGNNLGQREIIRWFSDVVEEDYDLIGQAEDVFVYRKKNGTPPAATYFQGGQNETRQNGSLFTKTQFAEYARKQAKAAVR